MKLKTLLTVFFIFSFFISWGQKEGFKINGTIANDYEGYIYLTYGDKVDSTLVKDKKFYFEGKVDYPTGARLNVKDGFFADNLYLENSKMDMELILDGKVIFIRKLTGNKTREFEENMESFIEENREKPEFPSELYKKIDVFFTENPRNQICAWVLSGMADAAIFTPEQIGKLLSKIDVSTQDKGDVEDIKTTLRKLSRFKVGTKFPHFSLPNTKGDLVRTDSFKDKVLLVEFWSSWCGPCRQNNPKLKEIYQEYNKKGFEIYGVSLDKKKEVWLEAIKKDGLVWTNTIAKEGWESSEVKSFGITYVPSNFLVDKNGNIVAINIINESLEKKLEELLAE